MAELGQEPAGRVLSGGRSLLRGSGLSVVIRLSTTVLSFATSVALARMLGADGLGLYATAMALVTVLSLLAEAGLSRLLVREIAGNRHRGDWRAVRGLMRWTTLIAGLSAVAAVAVCVLGLGLFGSALSGQAMVTTLLALVLVPVLALAALRVAVLQGLNHVLLAQLPEGLLRPGLFFFALVGFWLWNPVGITAGSAMGLQVAATAVSFVVGWWLLRRHLPAEAKRAPARMDSRTWLRSVLPLSLVAGVGVLNTHADLLMVSALAGAEPAGLYRVASRGAQLVLLALTAVNLVIAPTLSVLYVRGDMAGLQRLVSSASALVLLAALPLALVLIFGGQWLLGNVFGSSFTEASAVLTILVAGQVINCAVGPVALLANMTGHERETALTVGAALLANMALNLALIPRFGIEGAALATAVTTAGWNLWLNTRLRGLLGIDSSPMGLVLRPLPGGA